MWSDRHRHLGTGCGRKNHGSGLLNSRTGSGLQPRGDDRRDCRGTRCDLRAAGPAFDCRGDRFVGSADDRSRDRRAPGARLSIFSACSPNKHSPIRNVGCCFRRGRFTMFATRRGERWAGAGRPGAEPARSHSCRPTNRGTRPPKTSAIPGPHGVAAPGVVAAAEPGRTRVDHPRRKQVEKIPAPRSPHAVDLRSREMDGRAAGRRPAEKRRRYRMRLPGRYQGRGAAAPDRRDARRRR